MSQRLGSAVASAIAANTVLRSPLSSGQTDTKGSGILYVLLEVAASPTSSGQHSRGWVVRSCLFGSSAASSRFCRFGSIAAIAAIAANTFLKILESESCSPLVFQGLNDLGFFGEEFI